MSESCESCAHGPTGMARKWQTSVAKMGQTEETPERAADRAAPSPDTFAVIPSRSQVMLARIGVHTLPNESAVA